MGLPFVCLAAHGFRASSMARGSDFGKCQTFAASPAEPGELPLWFSGARRAAIAVSQRCETRIADQPVCSDGRVQGPRPIVQLTDQAAAHARCDNLSTNYALAHIALWCKMH